MYSKEYHKINTLFKRDNNNKITDEFCDPVYEMLENCQWEATEKIDGTNIRINLLFSDSGFDHYELQGRTDRAKLPPHLVSRIDDIIKSIKDFECFLYNDKYPEQVILYGEGYGHGIQKGKDYIDGHKGDIISDFILFDIYVDGYYFTRDKCEEIADYLGLDIVPLIGYMRIPEGIEFVKKGFKSRITTKDVDAEGLVMRPKVQLFDRNGKRIITKIKTRDFR